MNKKQDYQIISERIDDIVLLLSVMKQMKLPELIDEYLPRHWNQQGIDWGWVADFSRDLFFNKAIAKPPIPQGLFSRYRLSLSQNY